jgi:hypothetical protein
VILHVELADRVDQITLGDGHTVEPGPPLERAVSTLLGEGSYRLELRRERAAPRDPRRSRGRPGATPFP